MDLYGTNLVDFYFNYVKNACFSLNNKNICGFLSTFVAKC